MTQVLPQVPCYALCGVIEDSLSEEIQLHPAIVLRNNSILITLDDKPPSRDNSQGSQLIS